MSQDAIKNNRLDFNIFFVATIWLDIVLLFTRCMIMMVMVYTEHNKRLKKSTEQLFAAKCQKKRQAAISVKLYPRQPHFKNKAAVWAVRNTFGPSAEPFLFH